MSVLIKPILTEKAINHTDKLNVYAFIVDIKANKIEIKKEIEELYSVKVNKVRTMIHPALRKAKNTRKGIIIGKKKSYKKAIVHLIDDTIDFYNNI